MLYCCLLVAKKSCLVKFLDTVSMLTKKKLQFVRDFECK